MAQRGICQISQHKLYDALRFQPESITFKAVLALDEDETPVCRACRRMIAVHQARGDAPPANNDDSLREHFQQESELQREPWRRTLRILEAEQSVIRMQSVDDLRDSMASMAKAQMLSGEDLFLLSALLHGTDADRHWLAGTLLRRTGLNRVVAFNYYVARKRADSDAFLSVNGALLEHLPAPLFPPTAEYMALTEKLLAEYRTHLASVSGGEPDNNNFHPQVFRESAPLLGGEYHVPVQEGPHGLSVNLTEVDEAYRGMQGQIGELQRTLAYLRRTGSAAGSRGGTRQGSGRAGSSNYNYNYNRGRGGGQPRGNSNRGRGYGRGPRGGEADGGTPPTGTATTPQQNF